MTSHKKESRAAYRHLQSISTRWKDNDLYGHVNNVEYYSFFDTVINKWLIETGGLDIHNGAVIGVCAESSCRFIQSIAFPAGIVAGLRVAHLGRTSVRYEIGLFAADSEDPEDPEDPIATGTFVHVFVSRKSRKPEPIPDNLRHAFQELIVAGEQSNEN